MPGEEREIGRVGFALRWLREDRFASYPKVDERPAVAYSGRAVAFVAEAVEAQLESPLLVARQLLNAIDPVSGKVLSSMRPPPSLPRVLAHVEALQLGLQPAQAVDFAQRLLAAMRSTPAQSTMEAEVALLMAARQAGRCVAPAALPASTSPPHKEQPPLDEAFEERAPEAAPPPPSIDGRVILGTVRVVEEMVFAREGTLPAGARVELLAWRSAHEAAERRVAGYEKRPQVVIGWKGRARFVAAEAIERD